jgi:hypothetical protein
MISRAVPEVVNHSMLVLKALVFRTNNKPMCMSKKFYQVIYVGWLVGWLVG